jgi:hypothetical protein
MCSLKQCAESLVNESPLIGYVLDWIDNGKPSAFVANVAKVPPAVIKLGFTIRTNSCSQVEVPGVEFC